MSSASSAARGPGRGVEPNRNHVRTYRGIVRVPIWRALLPTHPSIRTDQASVEPLQGGGAILVLCLVPFELLDLARREFANSPEIFYGEPGKDNPVGGPACLDHPLHASVRSIVNQANAFASQVLGGSRVRYTHLYAIFLQPKTYPACTASATAGGRPPSGAAASLAARERGPHWRSPRFAPRGGRRRRPGASSPR